MARVTNVTNLPVPLYRALVEDDYDDGGADITATGLLQPPHLAALEHRHAALLSEDAADMARLLIGKAVHAYIARAATGEFDDKRRLFMKVNGWLTSGQTDHVFVNNDGSHEMVDWSPAAHTITDYKTVSVWEYMRGLRVEREQQLNIYAELLRQNGYPISSLSACLIFVDWSPRRARYEKDYPPSSIVDVEIPLWEQDEAQRFIYERIAAHQYARANPDAVECSDEERWASPAKWAVVKNGNSRATKLFDTEAEAEQLAAQLGNARIESREREYARCQDYCKVGALGLCAQWEGER